MKYMFMGDIFKEFRLLRFLGFKVVPAWYKEPLKAKKNKGKDSFNSAIAILKHHIEFRMRRIQFVD